MVELAGFVLLALAVWRDIVLRRRQEARVLGLETGSGARTVEATR